MECLQGKFSFIVRKKWALFLWMLLKSKHPLSISLSGIHFSSSAVVNVICYHLSSMEIMVVGYSLNFSTDAHVDYWNVSLLSSSVNTDAISFIPPPSLLLLFLSLAPSLYVLLPILCCYYMFYSLDTEFAPLLQVIHIWKASFLSLTIIGRSLVH